MKDKMIPFLSYSLKIAAKFVFSVLLLIVFLSATGTSPLYASNTPESLAPDQLIRSTPLNAAVILSAFFSILAIGSLTKRASHALLASCRKRFPPEKFPPRADDA